MCALGERLGELRKLAEDHATVPFGVRDVLAVLLVGGLGCQRESREAAVVGCTNFCAAAEEADEGYFVLVHECLRLWNLPILVGAPVERVGHAPKRRSSAFAEGPEKSFRVIFPNKIWRETVTRRAAQLKQK